MEMIHFHNNTSKQKQFFFQYLKDLKENDDISFFEYLNFETLMKVYILNLKIKLTKLHIFKNKLLNI